MEANGEQEQDLEVVKVTPDDTEEPQETTEDQIKKEFKSALLQVSIFYPKGLKISPFLCRLRSHGSIFNEALIGSPFYCPLWPDKDA